MHLVVCDAPAPAQLDQQCRRARGSHANGEQADAALRHSVATRSVALSKRECSACVGARAVNQLRYLGRCKTTQRSGSVLYRDTEHGRIAITARAIGWFGPHDAHPLLVTHAHLHIRHATHQSSIVLTLSRRPPPSLSPPTRLPPLSLLPLHRDIHRHRRCGGRRRHL